MKPKYKINKENRVVALRSFGDVRKGYIGGFVEKEKKPKP